MGFMRKMKKATKSVVKIGTNVAVTKLTGSATLGDKMSKVAGGAIGPVSKKKKKEKKEAKHEKKGYHPENDPTSKKFKKREKKHAKKGGHPENKK